jgi:hypothetical protein
VRDVLEADIYAKSGVWDVAKATIMPVSSWMCHIWDVSF